MNKSETGGEEKKALVLEIQRMSTEDGPGLRTTLFLKGCSLSCIWCHNPESISPKPQIRWQEHACIGCMECIETCRQSALSAGEGEIVINRGLCTGCGLCVEACPSGALEQWGKIMTVEETAAELLKDSAYFGDEGGVTVSGGEAALRSGFVDELFKTLHTEGVNTALDTCGACSPKQFELASRNADLILFDLKHADPLKHLEYTGGPLDPVRRNFISAAETVKNSRIHSRAWGGKERKLWIRTPVIPGMTDSRENIAAIAGFILEHGDGMFDRWELCAFNNLCTDKYRRLGLDWQLEGAPLMSQEEMDGLVQAAAAEGIDSSLVCWTGMVRDLHRQKGGKDGFA